MADHRGLALQDLAATGALGAGEEGAPTPQCCCSQCGCQQCCSLLPLMLADCYHCCWLAATIAAAAATAENGAGDDDGTADDTTTMHLSNPPRSMHRLYSPSPAAILPASSI